MVLVGRGARHLLGRDARRVSFAAGGAASSGAPSGWRGWKGGRWIRPAPGASKSTARASFSRDTSSATPRCNRPSTTWWSTRVACRWTTWRPWLPPSSAWSRRGQRRSPAGRRVLTLSRELGAGETQFATALGERLGMRVYDRELLEQEAVRLGVSEAEMEKIDEQPAGIFQRFRPGSIYQRYFEALETDHARIGPARRRDPGRPRRQLFPARRSAGVSRPPGRPDARSLAPGDGIPLGARARRQETHCRERRPAPQLLRRLFRRRLGQSAWNTT